MPRPDGVRRGHRAVAEVPPPGVEPGVTTIGAVGSASVHTACGCGRGGRTGSGGLVFSCSAPAISGHPAPGRCPRCACSPQRSCATTPRAAGLSDSSPQVTSMSGACTRVPGCHPGPAPVLRSRRIPAPPAPPVQPPHTAGSGRAGEATGRSASRCDSVKGDRLAAALERAHGPGMGRRCRAGRSRPRPSSSSTHCRSFGSLIRGYALQGGPCPHTPAVARGHRATSPDRAEALIDPLAFSGIAASPPSALEQPQGGPPLAPR